jgi:hypothetical protein
LELLPFGPLTDRTIRICVDMQNLFAEGTPWHTPWMIWGAITVGGRRLRSWSYRDPPTPSHQGSVAACWTNSKSSRPTAGGAVDPQKIERPRWREQIQHVGIDRRSPMLRFRVRIAAFLIAAGSFGPVAADQPDDVKAAIPGGPGVLTKCRGWLMTTSCRTYHHISLPSRIAVGDTITITFGNDPKEFGFFVARIDLTGQHCAIFSKADGDRHRMDKINVAPCSRADEGR